MTDVWIVGKGPSLMNLRKEHFGLGLVITINSSIATVEAFGLPNNIISMAKDGASPNYLNECPSMDCSNCPYANVYPQKAILMLHKHESIECMPDYFPRMIIDSEQYGLNWSNESVLLAIEFALSLGFDNFHFLCFDAVTSESTIAVHPDGSIFQNSGTYLEQAKRLVERCQSLQHEFIEPKPL